MSYILDALRRADAERDRGPVPGLHAQPAGSAVAAGAGVVAGPRSWRRDAAAAGTALLSAAMLLAGWWAWQGFGRDSGAVGTDRAGSVRVGMDSAGVGRPDSGGATVVTPAVTASTGVSGASPPPSAIERSVPVEAGQPPRQARAAATSEAPTGRPARRPAATAATPKAAATPVTPSAGAQVTAADLAAKAEPAGAAASAPTRVYAVEELPEDVRRDLPRLAIGGSIYSQSPGSRFVIVNGQLFHEGDTLAPGLVLQQIKLRSAVLAFRGYRYGIGY